MLSAPIFSQIRLLVDSLNKKDFHSTVAELQRVRTWERTHACGLCVMLTHVERRGSECTTLMISNGTNGLEFLNPNLSRQPLAV